MRFLVVGDAMVDKYWHGSVSRINPEKAAATLLDVKRVQEFPGGAANVEKNLASMFGQVTLVSGRGKITKHRLVDGDGIIARFDEDQGLDPIDIMELKDQARSCDAVLVSDYAKGSITPDVVRTVRSFNLPTFVDVKINADYWCDWAVCMFPNLREYNKSKRIYNSADCVVLKMGPNGVCLLNKGLQTASLLPPRNSVKCVAGAGDTLFAAYTASYVSLLSTLGKEKAQAYALKIAVGFAAVSVSSDFTSAPTWMSVMPYLKTLQEDDLKYADVVIRHMMAR